MAKKSREKAESSTKLSKADARPKQPFLVENEAVDPSLERLFASSVCRLAQSIIKFWSFAKVKVGWTSETTTEDSV